MPPTKFGKLFRMLLVEEEFPGMEQQGINPSLVDDPASDGGMALQGQLDDTQQSGVVSGGNVENQVQKIVDMSQRTRAMEEDLQGILKNIADIMEYLRDEDVAAAGQLSALPNSMKVAYDALHKLNGDIDLIPDMVKVKSTRSKD